MEIFRTLGAIFLAVQTFFGIAEAPPTPPETEYVLVIEEPAAPRSTVSLLTDNGMQTVSEDEYLTCVVLSELASDFSKETCKAQAVAARTFLRKTERSEKHSGGICTKSECCQAYKTPEELRKTLGTAFSDGWEKAEQAVRETKDEVLTYEGELIDAVYFACSGGRTEPAVAVWGGEVPYLQAVDSPGEEDAYCYAGQTTVPLKEFASTLQACHREVRQPVFPEDWVGAVTYTAGGGVATMVLGGVTFTGGELRKLFSLPSTKFSLTVKNGMMVFHTRGYGHGVGMSQFGAEAMAQTGAEYAQILQHYYPHTDLTSMP